MFFVFLLIVSLAAIGASPANDDARQPYPCTPFSCHNYCRTNGYPTGIGACKDSFNCVCARCEGISCNACCINLCKIVGKGGYSSSCNHVNECICK
jgi:hypothetical protein